MKRGLRRAGGLVELAFGGRKAGGIFVAVFLTEQADVNRATANFVKINIIRPAVGGGQILEQENVEEPPEQRIAANEIANARRSSASSFCTLLMKMRSLMAATIV